MNRIFLIGYMGAGKTTLGAPLAKALGFSFIDLDIYIENRYHKSINELFALWGEHEFRKVEQKVLKEVSTFERVVISTGGGTPCFFDNIKVMLTSGLTVYLEVSIHKLHQRLIHGKWKRPKLKNKTDAELLEFITTGLAERLTFYSQAHVFSSAENLESYSAISEAVEHIVSLVKQK